MKLKTIIMTALVLMWLLGVAFNAEARKRGGEKGQLHRHRRTLKGDHLLDPALVLLGSVPTSAFPDCRADESSFVPVILFLFPQTSAGDPAMLIGEARCMAATETGELEPRIVPIFFFVVPTAAAPGMGIDFDTTPDDPSPQYELIPGNFGDTKFIG